MKTLNQLLEKKTSKPEPTTPIEPDSVTSYVPRSKDEKRFMDKHVVQKTDDANGNGDDVFRGSSIKTYDRSSTRHGYNIKQDQEVYETKQLKSLSQILGEKTLTSAEKKKREEVATSMERDNPGMDMSKKMAIATATAKRVAEEALHEQEEDKAVREENELFSMFSDDIKEQLEAVFEAVDDECKQIIIEMIEAEEYNELVNIILEVTNG